MKVKDISKKTVEFFKKNGKRIVCSGLVAGAIALPFGEAIMEQKENEDIEMSLILGDDEVDFLVETDDIEKVTKILEQSLSRLTPEQLQYLIGDQEKFDISFLIKGPLRKRADYNGINTHRYIRKVYYLKSKVKFDRDFFKEYENVYSYFKEISSSNLSEMFDITPLENEEYVLTEEEAKLCEDTIVFYIRIGGEKYSITTSLVGDILLSKDEIGRTMDEEEQKNSGGIKL